MKEKQLGAMLDCSRGAVMNLPSLKRLIDQIAKMGYTYLELYTEDTYEIPEEPYFGYLRGRYTQAELREVDAYARERGVELVPCIQTLAHLDAIMRWDAYRKVNDFANILLVDEEETYQLIDRMFASVAASFTSRRIHIGMDEAHMVGLGRYLDKHGYQNRTDILLRHLTRVCEIADKYGFRPMMWSDMFFVLATGGGYNPDRVFSPAVLERVPKNLDLVYWDYYRFDPAFYRGVIEIHQKFNNPVVFAGGLWTWRGFAPLSERALMVTDAAMSACRETGVKDILMTLWGDDGGECSYFTALPMLFYAAKAVDGQPDRAALAKEFKEITGEDFEDMMSIGKINRLEPRYNFSNPAKAWLYQDPFLGMYDRTVTENAPAFYVELAQDLRAAAERSANCRDLYLMEADYAEAVSKKCDLGVKTRALYRAHDLAGLQALADTAYPAAVAAVERLHASVERVWFSDNKPEGYETHDIRLGGLVARLTTCADRLRRYATGELAEIPELEEEILPVSNAGDTYPDEQIWARISFPYGRSGHI